jgi:hypothetical protein
MSVCQRAVDVKDFLSCGYQVFAEFVKRKYIYPSICKEMFVCLKSHEQFLSSLATVTNAGDRAANLDLCLTLTAFSSEGSLRATPTSVFTVISERPVILPSECRAFGEGAITTYFKRSTRPA